jgi:phage minor structural protein
MPLNAAYADEIVQIDSNTYQLTFRFPTSDPLWEKLKEETFLTADDLHGEQDFVIFEVEKKHGYIQVYANQVFTLLNNYVVNPISLDRQTGSTALSRFAGAITRNNPFSFFSDIEDRHTFNIGSKNAMEALAKDKHSIIGQWGGDLVRHGYQVRLLKNGGSENESLFMYKKNLSSYQHKTSTKSLKTRITFTTTVKGEGEKAPDRTFTVTIDSPLINKYSQIYEDVIEVNDQDVKDEASLRKYGEQYYRTSLCDMMEDSLELEVVGQSDVPVQMFDIVSLFHDVYNLDVRKKITKYTYSPMGKKLKTIGFGQFKSGLANAIGSVVSDAVKGEAQQLQSDFERQLARELKNADLSFDRKKEELVNQFTDGLNAAKAKAEEVKRELSDTIDQRFSSFNNGPLQEAKRRAEEALQNAGASSLLAQEAKRIGLDSITKLEEFKRQATSAQTALSGDLDALKRTVANDIRPKQAQAETEIAKQVEALSQAKKELAGVKSAQATYEETTTRRLSELTNLTNGKASKSELTQTADELVSRIASVSVGGVNLFKSSRDFSGSWVNVGQWTKETEKYKGLTVMSRTGSWLRLSQPF